MKEEYIYDLIDLYLSGSMPEGHEFIERLKSDPQLADEVELQRMVTNAVVDHRFIAVSKEIHEVRRIANNKVRKNKLYKGIAAILTLVTLFSGIYLYIRNEETKTEGPNRRGIDVLTQNPIGPASNIKVKKKETIKNSDIPKSINLENKIAANNTVVKILEQNSSIDSALEANTIKAPISFPQQNTEANITKPAIHNVDLAFTRPCDTTNIFAAVHKISPCEKSSNGALHLENIKGGVLPYVFSIDGGKHFQDDKIFLNLNAGKFDVIIKDKNNCLVVVEKGLELLSKPCLETTSYVFDPLRESWEIPSDKQKGGKITIYNKYGQVVYLKNFAVMEQLSWNGTSENGEVLKPGYYIYTIEQEGGLLKQGSVTLSY